MHILTVSSEAYPYSKTGGLADMVGDLSRHLAKLGHDVRVVLPYYRCTREKNLDTEIHAEDFKVICGDKTVTCRILKFIEESSSVRFYFVDQKGYFDRPELYNENNVDYPDNAERFIFFCNATVQMTKYFDFDVDIIHCHDWQTGLIPALIKTGFSKPSTLKEAKTVFTIHNIGYQGNYAMSNFHLTGLPPDLASTSGLEFYQNMSLIKSGIIFSDFLTTVSPRYASEIQTPELGFGLNSLIKEKRNKLAGILNGIDDSHWNPMTDPFLCCHYGPEDLEEKTNCKKNLQNKMNFPPDPDIPLIGGISRIAHQKGYDMVASVLPGILSNDLQMVILGTGDPQIENQLENISRRCHNFKFIKAFDESLSHQIIAGCDIFMVPSRYEPCGLTQMFALKYGTFPVVHATGGLDDTVKNFDPVTGTGNGVKFTPFSDIEFTSALVKALTLFERDKALWKRVLKNGMLENHSWEHRVIQYHNLYRDMTRNSLPCQNR
ncbi:glycogen synthase GlgA [candidate division WOR-3 bacterium]|nr:glycogen synthase GlgA [candidate division WOR-3 bacterium]